MVVFGGKKGQKHSLAKPKRTPRSAIRKEQDQKHLLAILVSRDLGVLSEAKRIGKRIGLYRRQSAFVTHSKR